MFSRLLSSIVLLCCSSHRPCNLESLYSGPHHDVAPISSREQAWSSIFSHYEQWSCTHASTQIVTKWALCLPRSLARTCGICTIEKPLVLFPARPRFCLSCSLLSPQAGKPHGDWLEATAMEEHQSQQRHQARCALTMCSTSTWPAERWHAGLCHYPTPSGGACAEQSRLTGSLLALPS